MKFLSLFLFVFSFALPQLANAGCYSACESKLNRCLETAKGLGDRNVCKSLDSLCEVRCRQSAEKNPNDSNNSAGCYYNCERKLNRCLSEAKNKGDRGVCQSLDSLCEVKCR